MPIKIALLICYLTNIISIVFNKKIDNNDSSLSASFISTMNSLENNDTLYLTNRFSTHYFYKLDTNIGKNAKGSCGYVAVGMLLSYWDTYWDDSIIEERFDKVESTNDNSSIIDLEQTDSPGITQEPSNIWLNVSDAAYAQNVIDYAETYFQFKLMKIGRNYYTHDLYDYGMGYSKYISLFNGYLYDYMGFYYSDVEVEYTNSNVRNATIQYIQSGIPVKLSIANNNGDGHAVVAYDYDEDDDKIYCNFGWGANSTHVALEDTEFEICKNVFALKFKNNHQHSNNYLYLDSNQNTHFLCSCSSVLHHENYIYNNYLDTDLVFYWNNSLVEEKWFRDTYNNPTHYFEFKIYDSNDLIITTTTMFNIITMTDQQKTIILNANSDNLHIVTTLKYQDENNPYHNHSVSTYFQKPNRYKNKTHIKPNEWGLAPRYYFANEGIKETSNTFNGIHFTTKRLRCGYIENMYVVLSPRRQNAGYAYFEIHFDQTMYSFMYSVCLWSNNENLDGYAIIDVDEGDDFWMHEVDLLNDITLTTKENGVRRYVYYNSVGFTGIKFIAYATATGNMNRGRLCIEDLAFSNNPTSNTYPHLDY
ncbi:MAG: C10 family peptidase [Bacilli bacterium]|nr:C10 family peptidase [Bacilli bacterium]